MTLPRSFGVRTRHGRSLAMLIVIIVLVFAAAATAQNDGAGMPPERDAAIVALLNDARVAAPELAVDTMLKLLESRRISDAEWRREVLDEAIRTVDDVKYKIAMGPAYGGEVERGNELNDTEEFLRIIAFGQRMDQLSLRARIVTYLADNDIERAKSMLFGIGGRFGLKPRTCGDALTYSVFPIYRAVLAVAKKGFTAEQIANGQRAMFVAQWVENIESPRQVASAIDLVTEIRGSVAERQVLLNALTKAIDRRFNDDRSFTYQWNGIVSKMLPLINVSSDYERAELRAAFRGMLAKNLSGERCADNEIAKDSPLPDYIVEANRLLPDKPITAEDIGTASYYGKPNLVKILRKSSSARRFREELMSQDGQVPANELTESDLTKKSARDSWRTAFVDRVLSFEPSDGESDGEVLFIKVALVGAVLSRVKEGELRDSVLRRFIRLLANSPLQRTSFIDWYAWVMEARQMSGAAFNQIASEFPNSNLKLIIDRNKTLGSADEFTR